MTRCIYVGPEVWFYFVPKSDRPILMRYGITGRSIKSKWTTGHHLFIPDGDTRGMWFHSKSIYFPSKQQTRHCPKK